MLARTSSRAAFALASLLVPRVACAREPGETRTLPCRPTIACTADIVPPGAFELEAGTLFRRIDPSGASGGGRQWTFPFLAKLTATPWLQIQAGSNGYSLARGAVPAQFLDDAQLGAKLHLVDQSGARPSLAFSALASIPTFHGDGYRRTYDALFTAYGTKEVGPIHADLNAGLNVWRIERAPRLQQFIALALSMNLPPPFGIMGESYYFTDASPIALRDGGFLFAISHSPKPWLLFDLGFDVGMFPLTRAYSLFIGMSVVPMLLF